MVYIKALLSFGVLLPTVFCNCRQSSQENGDMEFTSMLIPNFITLGETCGDLRNGRTNDCSNECKETLNTMTTTYPWLFECDCQHGIKHVYSTNDCLADRRRLPICFEPENSCSKMYKVCNDSSTCRMKLNDYLTDCNDEFSDYESQIGCETVCMFAYEELLYDLDAEGLWDCTCDDRSLEWCQKFINRTDCDPGPWTDYPYPSDSYITTDPKPQQPSCFDESRIYCGGELDCQNTIGGDLFQLVECDQEFPDELYNCSSKCAMRVLQMKEKYPFFYECDCQKTLPFYPTNTCNQDKKRYESCKKNEPNPSCSFVFPCLDEPSNCSSSLLYNFVTNCSSNMFSKDPEDLRCTEECKTALERLSNSTEGAQLMQCRCDRNDDLCMSFQNDVCTVLTMPSESSQLSASVLMTFFVIFYYISSD